MNAAADRLTNGRWELPEHARGVGEPIRVGDATRTIVAVASVPVIAYTVFAQMREIRRRERHRFASLFRSH